MGCKPCPKYVVEAVKNMELYLAKQYDGRKIKKKASAPFIPRYQSELDFTPELNPTQAQYYQSLTSVLQRMVEPHFRGLVASQLFQIDSFSFYIYSYRVNPCRWVICDRFYFFPHKIYKIPPAFVCSNYTSRHFHQTAPIVYQQSDQKLADELDINS